MPSHPKLCGGLAGRSMQRWVSVGVGLLKAQAQGGDGGGGYFARYAGPSETLASLIPGSTSSSKTMVTPQIWALGSSVSEAIFQFDLLEVDKSGPFSYTDVTGESGLSKRGTH